MGCLCVCHLQAAHSPYPRQLQVAQEGVGAQRPASWLAGAHQQGTESQLLPATCLALTNTQQASPHSPDAPLEQLQLALLHLDLGGGTLRVFCQLILCHRWGQDGMGWAFGQQNTGCQG